MFYTHYKKDLAAARKRIALTETKIANTKLGKIEYRIYGEGLPVLWVHGILGGADQGLIFSAPLINKGFKIIAVSRFGYMESPLPPDSTPAAQADLYAALLDVLNISKISVVGFSSGAPSSIQFALRHPHRCFSSLILSGAVPPYKVPFRIFKNVAKFFFSSNFIFWCLMVYFPSLMMRMMGVPGSIQKRLSITDKKWLHKSMFSFLPLHLRASGIINDIWVTNPDTNKNYPWGKISVPTLMIHSVDDPMPSFETAKKIAAQIPNLKFLRIENGGHLHIGHQLLVGTSMNTFITNTQKAPVLRTMQSQHANMVI